MRVGQQPQARKFMIAGALAVALGAPANADDRKTAARPAPKAAVEIFSTIQSALRTHWFVGQIRIKKRSGLEFRRAISVGGRDCTFAVQGPLVGRRAYGLGFEFRF